MMIQNKIQFQEVKHTIYKLILFDRVPFDFFDQFK